MWDNIANIFLPVAHIWTIFSLLLCLLLWVGRPFFMQSLCLVLLDMMVNVALKGTFKLPLNPSLHEGYAFPSGHMQITTVFYGWLAFHVRSFTFRILMFILCVGEGFGLIHYDYHNLRDVMGGVVFAWLLILLYRGTLHLFKQATPWILICFATLCMLYNAGIYLKAIPPHAKQSYEFLLAVLLCERILSKNGKKTQDWLPVDSVKVNFL